MNLGSKAAVLTRDYFRVSLPFFSHGDDSLTLHVFVGNSADSSGLYWADGVSDAYIAIDRRDNAEIYAHELNHFLDWLAEAIGDSTGTEYRAYLAQYLTGIFGLWQRSNDQDEQGYTHLLSLLPSKPMHSQPLLTRGSVVFADSTCGKTALCAELIRRGARVIENDTLYWGVINRFAPDAESADYVSRMLMRRNDEFVLAVKRTMFCLLSVIQWDYVFTNILPNTPCAAYFVRDPNEALEIMLQRRNAQGKSYSLPSVSVLKNEQAKVYSTAAQFSKQVTMLSKGEFISDFYNVKVSADTVRDTKVVYEHTQRLLSEADLFRVILPFGYHAQRAVRHAVPRSAHDSVDVVQCCYPVIGLAGMGAETIVMDNGSFPYALGDSLGARSDPSEPGEWSYDPYYIWCKLLQLSEDGKTRLISCTGDYRVVQIAMMPYKKVFLLTLDIDTLLSRKNAWRAGHGLVPLSLADVKEDFDAYQRALANIQKYRDVILLDAAQSPTALAKSVIDAIRSSR